MKRNDPASLKKRPARLLDLSVALLLAMPSVSFAAKKKSTKAAPKKPEASSSKKKKTVAELLAQVREESRGGAIKLEKTGTALPGSQLKFQEESHTNLDSVKPPKSSELMRTEVSSEKADYVRVLDQQIGELYKLTQKFKNSANRGEMWLRLAELYVEKATILDSLAQDEYDRKLKAFQGGQTKTKPTLDVNEAREYNKKAIQLYEWFERDFPRDPKMSQAYFFLGFNHFEIGNVKKGAEYYERLTKQFPESPFVKEAYFALGEYYFENDKWAQAYKEYSPILKDKKHKLHSFALYKGAWCLYRMGKTQEALNYLEVIIKTAQQDDSSGNRKRNRSKLEAEALRDIVVFYASAGRPEEATNYFKNLVGGDVTSYVERLAYYYSDKGNREGAHEVFRQLISQRPTHPKAFEYQYQVVQNYFYAKNSPKFREELYRWIHDYSADSEWGRANASNAALMANSLKLRETTLRNWTLQQHQTAQNSRAPYSQGLAVEGYQLYLKEFASVDQTPDMRFYYGELLYDMGRFDQSSAQYQWVIEHAANSKFADKAATNLILSVEKDVPDDKELAKRVGTSLEPVAMDAKTERFIKAGKWYVSHFPNSPKTPEIRFRIGRLYYQTNQFDAATAEFKDIVRNSPRTKYAEYSANLLLDIYNLKKDYVGLEKTGQELLAMPSIAGSKAGADIRGVLEKASFKKAQDLEGEKKYGESAAYFEAFATQNPTSPLVISAIFNSGVNYERAGDSGRAQVAYRKILQSDAAEAKPLKPKVQRLLAKLAQDSYRIEEAARLYKASALENPGDPLSANMMFNAALLYQVQGRSDEAIKSYDAFIKMSKKHRENTDAVYQIAKLHDKAGQKAAAYGRYKDFLAASPADPDMAMEAQGRLFELSQTVKPSETEQMRQRVIGMARRLGADGKKYDAQYAAKAKLMECDRIYNDLAAIRFSKDANKLKSTLEKKAEVLASIIKCSADVIKYNSGGEIVSALALSGKAYDHMASALRAAPLPSGLTPDQEKQYREGVEKQFVEPNVAKAKEFYEKAVRRGWELEAYNDAYNKALDHMNKIEPQIYYSGGQVGNDSRYINWMTQQ